MSFSRNTIDRCLRGDSVDGFFCSCAMVSSGSDVRGRMDPSVRRSCIRTQDAGVLSRLEISVRRFALVDEQASRSRIRHALEGFSRHSENTVPPDWRLFAAPRLPQDCSHIRIADAVASTEEGKEKDACGIATRVRVHGTRVRHWFYSTDQLGNARRVNTRGLLE